jgi:hypothetical protein
MTQTRALEDVSPIHPRKDNEETDTHERPMMDSIATGQLLGAIHWSTFCPLSCQGRAVNVSVHGGSCRAALHFVFVYVGRGWIAIHPALLQGGMQQLKIRA